jgi:hypothetical protein
LDPDPDPKHTGYFQAADNNNSSSAAGGRKFMTDLLVSSLMADGGLRAALKGTVSRDIFKNNFAAKGLRKDRCRFLSLTNTYRTVFPL